MAGAGGGVGGGDCPRLSEIARGCPRVCETGRGLKQVEEMMCYFEERTPESRVERRDRTIRWSYESAANGPLGAQHASNLVESLEKTLSNAPVEVLWDAAAVEVSPLGSVTSPATRPGHVRDPSRR